MEQVLNQNEELKVLEKEPQKMDNSFINNENDLLMDDFFYDDHNENIIKQNNQFISFENENSTKNIIYTTQQSPMKKTIETSKIDNIQLPIGGISMEDDDMGLFDEQL